MVSSVVRGSLNVASHRSNLLQTVFVYGSIFLGQDELQPWLFVRVHHEFVETPLFSSASEILFGEPTEA